MPNTRELTLEEAEYYRQQGLDPSDLIMPVAESNVSIPSTIGRTAKAHGGGWLGGGLGGAGGVVVGAALAPETGGLSLLIPAVGALLGGAGGSYLGSKAQEAVLPDELNQRLQQEAQEAQVQHPYVSLGTDIVGGALAGGGRPSLAPIKLTGSALRKVGVGAGRMITNAERNALGNVVVANSLNAGLGAGLDLATTGEVDPKHVAAGLIGGTLFANPSPYGKLITRGHWKPVEGNRPITQTERTDVTPGGELYSDVVARDKRAVDEGIKFQLNKLREQTLARQNMEKEQQQYTVLQRLGGLLNPKVASDKDIIAEFKKQFISRVTGNPLDKAELRTQNEEFKDVTTKEMRKLLYGKSLQDISPEVYEKWVTTEQGKQEYTDWWKGEFKAKDEQFKAQSNKQLEEQIANETGQGNEPIVNTPEQSKFQPADKGQFDKQDSESFDVLERALPWASRLGVNLGEVKGGELTIPPNSSQNPGSSPLPARGIAFTQLRKAGQRLVGLSRKYATSDTPFHELYHWLVNDLSQSTNPATREFIKGMNDALGGEEKAATKVGRKFVSVDDAMNRGVIPKYSEYLKAFWSNLKQNLGIANEGDVSRIGVHNLREANPEALGIGEQSHTNLNQNQLAEADHYINQNGQEHIIITPSVKSPGKWQLSEFMIDPDGNTKPLGDSQFDSHELAIKSVEDNGKFKRVEDKFQPGEDNSKDQDIQRYNELVTKVRTAPLEERPELSREIEEIKNKYGGKPPTVGDYQADRFSVLDNETWKGLKGSKGIQIYGTLRNKLGPDSGLWKVLDTPEFREFVTKGNKSAEEVRQYIEDNGPQIEVRKFENKEENLSKLVDRRAQIEHELDTLYPNWHSDINNVPENVNYKFQKLSNELSSIEYQLINGRSKDSTNWHSISPKSEQDMPGYVEIAVVKPQKKYQFNNERGEPEYVSTKNQFESSHSFPPNTLVFTRGFEYNHPEKGLGFLVIENQTDTVINNHDGTWSVSGHPEFGKTSKGEALRNAASIEPLVSHWERLGLKAVIDHVNEVNKSRPVDKQIKWVGISDAETAMLTEGHDRAVSSRTWRGPAESKEDAIQKVTKANGASYKEGSALQNSDGSWSVTVTQLPTQSEGMRLHYDPSTMLVSPKGEVVERFPTKEDATAYARHNRMPVGKSKTDYKITKGLLHEIMEELTGGKGERVEMGEHRMAREPAQYGDDKPWQVIDERGRAVDRFQTERQAQNHVITQKEIGNGDFTIKKVETPDRTRKDLIFRNPDGTPKTTVSGLVYPITKARPEFTLMGKDKPVSQELSKYQPVGNEVEENYNYSTPWGIKLMTPRYEKIHERFQNFTGKYVSDKMVAASKWINQTEGKIGNRLIGLLRDSKLDTDQLPVVTRYLYDLDQTGQRPNIRLTPAQQTFVDNYLKVIQEPKQLQKDLGLMVKTGGGFRVAGVKENGYFPNMLDPEVAYNWIEKPGSELSNRYDKLYKDYLVGKGMTPADANSQLEQYKKALNNRVTTDTEFGALNKAEGKGLPFELTDKNLARVFSRYGRRASRHLGYFKFFQDDPKMRKAFSLSDQFGNSSDTLSEPDMMYIGSSKEGQAALDSILGRDKETQNELLSAGNRLVGNTVMGVGTSLRNLISEPAFIAPYLKTTQLPVLLTALTQMKGNAKRAFENNAIRVSFSDFDAAGDFVSHPNPLINRILKMSSALRKYQGRDVSDTLEGLYAFTIGDIIGKQNIASAKNGDTTALKWLNKFGTNVDVPALIKSREVPQQAIDTIAKNFVDSVRGTYSAEGLPSWAIEGTVAPFTQLSRFSIEKANQVWKDVMLPIKGGDFRPILKLALGTLVTGAAIEKLNELLTKKRGPDATIKEVDTYGDKADVARKLIGLWQLGSAGGIVTDFLKLGSNIQQGKGTKYTNPLSFPLYSFMTDNLLHNMGDFVTAVNQGEDVIDSLGNLATSITTGLSQTYRYADARYINPDNAERKEKFRDVRVFNELVNKKVTPSSEELPRTISGQKLREFKRSQDLGESVKQLPSLIQDAIQNSNGDPEKLKANLIAIKQNNYQTMPNPETMPIAFMKYIEYLKRTQGDEEAQLRLLDYLKKNQIDRAKGSLVPSI